MRHRSKTILAAALLLAAAPAFAGIHYKATTKSETSTGAKGGPANAQVEGWVSGDKARVEFHESGNPMMKAGSYLVTKDGGKTLYIVNPEEKTYAVWDLQAMMGMVGGVMNGMGPLLKFQFTDPKVEKLVDENGGTLLGLPTRHVRYRTSYSLTIKVLGMGNTSDVLTEEDIWTTQRLQDAALGVWLRSDPPRTGNEQLDKMIAASRDRIQGFPLKTVMVSTNTSQKGGKKTETRTTMEVTQLDTSANVPASSFEIPAGYKETQMMAPQQGEQGNGEQEEQGGLLGRLRKKRGSGGGGGMR